MVEPATGDVQFVEAPATIVRTLRFEVAWPGWRRKDLHALWKELWAAQQDLICAANRTVSALFLVKIGALPRPAGAREAKPASDKTLAYQAMSGKWQPWGVPLYVPSEGVRRVGSQVTLDLANTICARLDADWTDLYLGRKSLPTWRSAPIGATNQGVRVNTETGEISMPLWAGNGQRVTLRPRKLDPKKWAELRSAVKFGSACLQWHQPVGRKGRWMISLSLERPVKARPAAAGELVCAVRLGMYVTCTLAYASAGQVERYSDAIDIPSSTWRAVRRVQKERIERGLWNRKDHGVRVGRGRARKLRATERLGDLTSRVTETAVRHVAAAVVAKALERGATRLVLPDFKRWSVASELDRTEDLTGSDRASHRRWYFRWHQGALIDQISQVWERETGSKPEIVNPSGSRATCSSCGGSDGERKDGTWTCPCGCSLPVEINTARVLVRRGAGLDGGPKDSEREGS